MQYRPYPAAKLNTAQMALDIITNSTAHQTLLVFRVSRLLVKNPLCIVATTSWGKTVSISVFYGIEIS